MSATKSQEASSPASPFRYDVFLSFKGPDTSNSFIDHLFAALNHAGFHTFRDADLLEVRDYDPEKVIRESRMSIIVLSNNYARSAWCLEELVMILKLRTFGHIVVPIFYYVNRSEVRKQIGSFEEAFMIHEERIEFETDELVKEKLKDMLRKWRAALKEVANLAGMVIPNQADG
ncbi:disease resistance protein RUN1-like [Rhododendron vialii]|uniref:disease resistance protein RUN1-like n=1 Tax=Rhododendron vialii TaxID=182163 RepID=UPI00265DC0AB|nr:disease resistance protein RUN1-like [Rhododendron vialii]